MPDVPPGWPDSVPPPGTPRWEQEAICWILDLLPPNYREAEDIRQYPAALAALARHHIRACWEGTRQGYRIVRTELGQSISPEAIPEVLAAYRSEGTRLSQLGHALRVIEPALRDATGPAGRLDGANPGGSGAGSQRPPDGRRRLEGALLADH